jgi:hypothetical protein
MAVKTRLEKDYEKAWIDVLLERKNEIRW